MKGIRLCISHDDCPKCGKPYGRHRQKYSAKTKRFVFITVNGKCSLRRMAR